MRQRSLAAIALIALGIGLWLLLQPSGKLEVRPRAADAVSEGSGTDPHPRIDIPEMAPGGESEETRLTLGTTSTSSATPAAPSAGSHDETIVRGRLLDDAGGAIPGALISLFSVDGTWAAGSKAPSIRIRNYEVEGFQIGTASDGRFEFHTPLPATDWVSLHIDPPKYYGITGREFGFAGGRNQPRLLLGMNDLGDVVVPITGAVRGQVLSSDGATLTTGARVTLNADLPDGYSVGTEVDATGNFELGHVPEGSWALQAEADGWLLSRVREVRVRRKATTEGVEFRLERSPTISGIAVDEAGVPQAGVKVWGWPVGSGRGSGGRTGDDGTFTIFLAQNEPHVLQVWDQDEYEAWGGKGLVGATFEAGRSDIRIVLKRSTRFTFRVVDAVTGMPIEHFGIRLGSLRHDGGSWIGSSPMLKEEAHPGGVAVLGALLGQQSVRVVATGYAPFEIPVIRDSATALMQTLRLVRGGAIAGRVTLLGRHLAGAILQLDGDLFKVDPSLPDKGESLFEGNKGFDTSDLEARGQFVTDAEGAIKIECVAAGTYRLTISGGGSARRVLKGLVVKEGETTDLGMIQVEPGNTIRGRIVLSQGQAPVGLEVRLGDGFDRETRVTSPDGTFSFEGVEAGEHILILEPHPPLVFREEVRSIMVRPGSSQEVVFDLTSSAPCDVELRILLNGHPVSGVTANWRAIRDGRPAEVAELGRSDDSGIVHGFCPGGNTVRFEVFGRTGFKLAQSQSPVVLIPGDVYSERIDASVGTLVVVLPSTLEVPEVGTAKVLLSPTDSPDDSWNVIECRTLQSPFRKPGTPLWEDHRLEIGDIGVGEYRAAVHTYKLERQTGAGVTTWSSIEIASRFEELIRVEAGKTTTMIVP